MRNRFFAILVLFAFAAMSFGVVQGVEKKVTKTEAYKKQAASCNAGNKVKSYLAYLLVKEEEGIEKLRAVLEKDCIDGFKNSMGGTLADDLARLGHEASEYMSLCRSNEGASLYCYFNSEVLNWFDAGSEEMNLDELPDRKKEIKEMKRKVRLLVESEWLTREMCEKVGFRELDIALIKNDGEKVVSILDEMPSMKAASPAKNAELLRFLSFSNPRVQYLVTSHKNYSGHLMSSHIKDPMFETVVFVSGPADGSRTCRDLNAAIDRMERLGLNWIMLGGGVDGIDLQDVERLKPLLDGLKGKITFLIEGHGGVNDKGEHIIKLGEYYIVRTCELFEVIKKISDGNVINVIMHSCYSGAAYTDAIEVLSEGSQFFSSTSMNKPSQADTKLMINGIDRFMESKNEFNSVFDLFNLAYLYKQTGTYTGQIVASVSKTEPFFLEMGLHAIDFEYVRQNKEKIIGYLKNYVDERVLKEISAFLNMDEGIVSGLIRMREQFSGKNGKPINREVGKEYLSRMVQYAVAMTRDVECVLNKARSEPIEAAYMNEDYIKKLISKGGPEAEVMTMILLRELETVSE